ncbi:uncharacterized protein [Chanodichthys erythropterus]|uniref:uncharacterized protein isoform X2 n=1 Tax=Chanodichthys erythropterus TaxID=933992 RepID=UPI00351EE845
MDIKCVYISVLLMVADGNTVRGSSGPLVAPLGSSVVLPCNLDELLLMEGLEVEWRRTDLTPEQVSWKKRDKDEDILVLLYQNKQTLPDSSDEQYRDRVEFFTAEIPKGNFSLRLKGVRAEDRGVYVCQVFAGELSANATVVLKTLGFSSLHVMVLVFCFAAGSGAVLLLCCLIYCRSANTVSSCTIWSLQLSLVFCPNICMSFAFIFWALTEGFLHESITCCALYILRPVMLIWALPCLNYLQDSIKTWIKFFKITQEFAVFTVILHSVILKYGLRRHAHDANIALCIMSGISFGFVVLLCLILSGVDFIRITCQKMSRGVFPCNQTQGLFPLYSFLLTIIQLFHLMFSLELSSPAFLIVAFVTQVLLVYIPFIPLVEAKLNSLCQRWIMLLWLTTLLHIILQIYFHLDILQKEKVLRMMVVFENSVPGQTQRQRHQTNQQESNALHLCNEIMYMFGAVGLVLLSSVTLTAELILKARNGDRVLKDLRFIVFPSEGVFALYWLVLQMNAYWKIVTTEDLDAQRRSHQKDQLMNSPETEMENLSTQ